MQHSYEVGPQEVQWGEGQPTGSECSIHMKLVHRRCSGVKGRLQAASAAFI